MRDLRPALIVGLIVLCGCGQDETPARQSTVATEPARHAAVAEPAAPAAAATRRILVDTDMGLDDVRALFALLAADEIGVDGVTTVEGSAAVGRATDHVIGLLESLGCDPVPVAAGRSRASASAPPWRTTADALAGAKFPPPRGRQARIDSVRGVFDRFLRADAGERSVLALGPLTNLQGCIAGTSTEPASGFTIWLPGQVAADGRVTAWNLSWNLDATRSVFARSPRIVIVEVGSAGRIELDRTVAAATEATPALGWIRRVLAATSGDGPHRFIYDELAVAAVSDPALVRLDDERRRLTVEEDGGLRLVPDAGGNVSVARFDGSEAAAAWLLARWRTPAVALAARYKASAHPHDHPHVHADDPHVHANDPGHAHDHAHDHAHMHASALPDGLALTTYLRAFHGHLGPYVVIGYRLGRHALELAGSDGHFGIRARVHCAAVPPGSCLADGIQLGAGCTLGKRNIELVPTEGTPQVVFETSGGKCVTLRLQPDVAARIKAWVDTEGVEAAGRRFLTLPLESFLEQVR